MITIETAVEAERWADIDHETIINGCLSSLEKEAPQGLRAGEISVLLTNDSAVQVLNRDWREKDSPTNVLSFPADDMPLPEGMPVPLGDIALAYETCLREAEEKDISLEDHVSHLILHGILHLLGYVHDTVAEAVEMEDLEIRLLANMGIANPYSLAD